MSTKPQNKPTAAPVVSPEKSAEEVVVQEVIPESPVIDSPAGGSPAAEALAVDGETGTLEEALNQVVAAAGETGELNENTPVNLEELAATGEVGAMVAEAAAIIAEDEKLDEAVTPAAEELPQVIVFWKHDIAEYFAKMAPGVPQYDYNEGALRQRRFVQRLLNASNYLGDHYQAGMDHLLSVIDANSGKNQLFNDDYVFRFYDEPVMRRNKEEREKYITYMTFLKMIAKPETRKIMVKQCDMKLVLACLPDELSQRRLLNYLG